MKSNGNIKSKNKYSFRLGELFAGPGGIALGAKNAYLEIEDSLYSIKHAWATDYDPDTCETYSHNICSDRHGTVICEDIRKLDFNKLKNISAIDALAFGFPCNDFSVVGEQKGINGNYGPLYSYGVKALKYFTPKWFLAENVGGLKNSNEGKTFDTILQEFYDAGYSVYPHLYKFNEYGVPQARQRIIIIGIHKDFSINFKVPSPKFFSKINVSCRSAIEFPPIKQNDPNNELTKQSANVIERLKYIKPGENVFTADLPDHLKLNVRGAKISQIYKRLDPEKPAYTVTGSGGGGTHMYHWKENRALTSRERARLQTFPDDFIFKGSKESVRKQIGMAVPVKGVQVIFEAILKCFASVKYENIPSSFSPLIHKNQIKAYNSSLEEYHQLILFEKNATYRQSKKAIYADR